jgi:glycosyltransferase involved in cell wall biosynthesis
MPSLNVAAYIRETMDSVLTQTLSDIEIICVDAGSTDGTMEILEEYASEDNRVRLIRSEKKSYGHQMNIGIKAASGSYIGIVETDDYIEPDMYEKLYMAASKQDADIAKANFDMFTTDNKGIRVFVDYSLKRYNSMEYDKIYSCEDYFSGCIKPECYIWNAIYKRQFLTDKMILFNETPGASFQDFSYRYQTNYFAQKIIAIDRVLYHYRRDNTSASTYNRKTAEYNYRETRYTLDIIEKKKESDNIRLLSAFAKECVEYAIWPYIEILKWSEPSENTDEALLGYRELFSDYIKKGILSGDNTEQRLWWFVNLLLEGLEVFKGTARVFARFEKEKVLKYVTWLKSAENIVVFGTGVRGKAIYAFLKNNGFENVFCDNRIKNNCRKLFGTDIMLPEEAVRIYPQALYIITSPSNEKEMREQLIGMGIDEDRISLYPLMVEPLFCTNCMIKDRLQKR